MNDLAFLDRYKEIRKRLNGGKAAVKVIKLEEVKVEEPPVPVPPTPPTEDYVDRSKVRVATIIGSGISYRQALLKGSDGIPKRAKLAILPVLEESNYSWEELFGKSHDTKRNNRRQEAVRVKWEIFKIMHFELGFKVNRIATWCQMDHTSVFYGLGLLKRKGKVAKTNDRDQ